MYLGLIVLTIHKHIEEAIGCLETENLKQVTLLVIDVVVRIFTGHVIQNVISIDDLLNGYAKVPDDLRGAAFVFVQFGCNDLEDLIQVVSNGFMRKNSLLVSVVFLGVVQFHQVLNKETQSTD